MKILIIGGTGLIGSRIIELLSSAYEIQNFSYETGIDITRLLTLDEIKKDKESKVVLHLAAKTDVDGCEKDKDQGEKGDCWRINVSGTKNIVDICTKAGKKLIYMSTDFVFDGENLPPGGYSEEDKPHPKNWYGATKYEGEKIVEKSGLSYIILRTAYPFRAKFPLKRDFVRAIISRLHNKEIVLAVADHIFTPTFIDDIVYAIDALIKKDVTGIFHVVGSTFLSPYEAAIMVAEKFNYDKSLIQKTTREEYFRNRAMRPFNLSLKNDKIQGLGVRMRTFEEGLTEVARQLQNL